jgi:tetratricopeptide (TPR) repeat protein
MNQLISAQLTKGDTEAATNALKEVLAADGFGDLRDWATREYYRLAQEKGDLAAAVAALEQEKGRNPNNTGLISSVIEGYVRTREWPKVADGYQTLLKKNPDDYILNTRLNDVYMIQGNYAEVIKRLEPIVKANPADVGHSDILARAYVGAGMQQEALALYQQKLAVDPNSPGLVGRYAQALTDFGKLDEAANQWDKAYQLDPRNSFFKQKADELKAKLGKTQ